MIAISIPYNTSCISSFIISWCVNVKSYLLPLPLFSLKFSKNKRIQFFRPLLTLLGQPYISSLADITIRVLEKFWNFFPRNITVSFLKEEFIFFASPKFLLVLFMQFSDVFLEFSQFSGRDFVVFLWRLIIFLYFDGLFNFNLDFSLLIVSWWNLWRYWPVVHIPKHLIRTFLLYNKRRNSQHIESEM